MKKHVLLFLFVISLSFRSFSQCGTTVVPGVTIFPDRNAICQGQGVTFTATSVNGGPSPTFIWKVDSYPPVQTSVGIFTTSNLSPGNKVTVDLISNASCASPTIVTSNVLQINVTYSITPGSIGTDQTVCYNTPPNTITQISPATGVTSAVVYTWETSTDGVNYTSTSDVGITLTPPLLTVTTWYRRIATDPTTPLPCNTATSNAVKMTVLPAVTPGVITGDQTVCSSQIPSVITSIVLPTGGNATYTYAWESSMTGNNFFTVIPAATNASYAPGNLTEPTFYRRRETNTCQTVFSNVVTKTVTPNTIASVTTNDPGQTCAGAAITFIATATGGGTTPVYQWYLGATPVGTNNSTYTHIANISDNGKQVTVKLTSSDACNTGAATTSPITLDIVNSTTPTVSIQASNNPNCAGLMSTFSISNATGTGNAPTYQWYVNGSPVGTGTSFSSATIIHTADLIWVEMTSSLNCIIGANQYASNKIQMLIKPVPYPVINESDKTICTPEAFTFTSTVSSGTTLQWNKNGALIAGATNITYTATQSGTYSITEDNGVCNTTSPAVTLTVDPCGAFSTFIAGPNPVRPGEQNLVYSVPNQSAFGYEWNVTGGIIVSGQGTSSITVDWDESLAGASSRTTLSSYIVSVTETNANKQKQTLTMYVSPTATSVAASLAQSGITLFPNPATESFNIEMPESGIAVNYEILDLTGASVAQGNFVSDGTAEKIAATFGAGMYQVVLRYNNVVTTARLSKVQ